jgi:hypothetical protein
MNLKSRRNRRRNRASEEETEKRRNITRQHFKISM